MRFLRRRDRLDGRIDGQTRQEIPTDRVAGSAGRRARGRQELINQLFHAALRCAGINGRRSCLCDIARDGNSLVLMVPRATPGLFTCRIYSCPCWDNSLGQLIEMIKSALGLAKFSGLRALVDGRLTSALARLSVITSRSVCTTRPCGKEIRMRTDKVKVGQSSKYGLLEGETMPETINVNQQEHLFPDADTPNRLFNGVPYKELHIVNIKSTPNNTIMSLTDFNGQILSLHTAGIEGYKNAKKGTNLAAQQAAITLGNRILEYGINTVRIRVQGIGAGRMSSIKGLQMTGLNIVSITDSTRVSWHPPRPRKQRRL